MRHRARFLLCVLCALHAERLRPTAQAQDDWAITREQPAERSPRRAPVDAGARALRTLLAAPEDELAFERLVAQRRAQAGGIAALEQELRAELVRSPPPLAPALALARLLVSLERWDEAQALLARVVAEASDPVRIRLFRARLARMHGAPEEARTDFAWTLAQPAASKAQRQEALRALGELALAEGKLEQARDHYRELATLHSGGWQDAREFPRALAKLGRNAEAVRAYRELLERVHKPRELAVLLLELGRTELAAGEPDAALESLARARGLDPRLEPEVRMLETDALRRAARLAEVGQRREREAEAGRTGAWREAAAIWQELGDSARALRCLRALLKNAPGDVAARSELAALLRRESDFAGAEIEYRRLVREAPGSPSFVVSLADLLAASGRRAEALALAARSSANFPRATALHVALRELYVRWGEHALAAHELDVLAKLEPQNPSHAVALAERALAAGDRSAALQRFTKLYGGEDARSQLELARLLEQHDLIAEAIPHARRARELAPDDAQSQRLLASLLERAARGVEAESAWQALLDNASADEPLRREARRHLAVLWRRAGRLVQRTSELEAELRSHPDDLARMRLLAELYARDPTHAGKRIALLQRLLAQRPDDGEVLLALEQAEFDRGAVSAGLQAVLRQLAGLAPNDASTSERVAHALELSRRHVHAAESPALVARALALRPRDASAYASTGDFHALRAEWELARAAYERAVELDPRAFRARVALAREALRRGDATSARTQLQQVIVGSTDDQLVSDALALLAAQPDESVGPWLLERALAAPERAVLRRFVLERELLPWLAEARRLHERDGTTAEREQLSERVVALRSLLFAALRGQSATERLLVLPFLAAAPQATALEPLLWLAEQEERSLEERAEALIAVGRMRHAAARARLQPLATRGSRRLRPLALWALSESAADGAVAVLRMALDERDEALGAMAAILAGQRHEATLAPRLRALVVDARDVVRAAALWALARIEPQSVYEPAWASLLSARSELAQVALTHAPKYAAEGLFSSDSRVRGAAVELLRASLENDPRTQPAAGGAALEPPSAALVETSQRVVPLAGRLADHENTRAPAPRWSFDVRHYLVQSTGTNARFELAPESLELLLAEAAAARLQASSEQALRTLALLVPEGEGLTPRAFVEASVCLAPRHGRALAERLHGPLAALARAEHPVLRARALALLVATGGSDSREARRALTTGDRAQLRAVLGAVEELTAQARLPDTLRAALAPLLEDPEWPVRMHAARVLRHAQTLPQLAHDPIALVRASRHKSAAIQRCPAQREGATN